MDKSQREALRRIYIFNITQGTIHKYLWSLSGTHCPGSTATSTLYDIMALFCLDRSRNHNYYLTQIVSRFQIKLLSLLVTTISSRKQLLEGFIDYCEIGSSCPCSFFCEAGKQLGAFSPILGLHFLRHPGSSGSSYYDMCSPFR